MVRLPEDAAIEFGLKAKGKAGSELLVYHAGFEAASGNLHSAAINCATTELHDALGIGDNGPANDKATLELSGEIGWTVGGQHFRSQTFPVIAEAPVVSSDAPAPLSPPNYPSPENLLLRGDLPFQVRCPIGNSAAQNGAALLALYADTKNASPNGLPLGSKNRVALLLPPAIYDIGTASLVLDSPYIDLVGLGTQESVVIVSSGSTIWHQAFSSIRNLTLRTSANVALVHDANDPAAYFPDDGLAPHLEDVSLIADHDGTGAWSMRQRISYDGFYRRVIAEREAFEGRGAAAIPARATITVNAIPADGETLEIPDYYGNTWTFEFDDDEWSNFAPIQTVVIERPRRMIRLDSVPEEGDVVTVDCGWGNVLTFRFTSGGEVPYDEIEVVIVPGDTSATAEALRTALYYYGWFEELRRKGSQLEIVFSTLFSVTDSSVVSGSAAISTTYEPRGPHAFTPAELAQEIAQVVRAYGFRTEVIGATIAFFQPGSRMAGPTWIGGSYTGLDVTDFSGGTDAIVPVCSGTIDECSFEGALLCRFAGRLHSTRITAYGEPTGIYVQDGAELDGVVIETNAPYSVAAHELDESARVTLRHCTFERPAHPNVTNLAKPLAISEGGTGARTVTGAHTAFGLGSAATRNTGTASGQVPLIGTGNKLDASILPVVSGSKRIYAIASAGDGRQLINNTTAEASLITSPYGLGSLLIPAGVISSGNIIRITIKGVWTTLASDQGNLSIRVKNGNDILSAFVNRALPANIVNSGASNPPWFEIIVLISVRATMNSTVSIFMRFQTAVNGPETLWTGSWNTGDSTPLNWNNAVNLDVTAQFSVASTSNKLQVYHGFVEQL